MGPALPVEVPPPPDRQLSVTEEHRLVGLPWHDRCSSPGVRTAERRHAMTRTRTLAGWLLGLLIVSAATAGHAAGTLTPVGSPHQPIRIKDHQVNVVITNGFARTEVLQTFHNPNDADLEALYSFPVPKSASLSEVTLYLGEREIH